MDSAAGSLQVELEDTGGTRWWKRLLATLSSQYGNAYRRFVGRVDGQVRYAAPRFRCRGRGARSCRASSGRRR